MRMNFITHGPQDLKREEGMSKEWKDHDGERDTHRQITELNDAEQKECHKNLLKRAKELVAYANETDGAQVIVLGGAAGKTTLKSFIAGMSTPANRALFTLNLIESLDPMTRMMVLAKLMGGDKGPLGGMFGK